LGRDITRAESYSEDTAREIDMEMKKIVAEAKNRSDKIIRDHKDQLELLAQELLKRETLSAKEVKELLGMEEKPGIQSADAEPTKDAGSAAQT
jgi:cell division protease FtsH